MSGFFSIDLPFIYIISAVQLKINERLLIERIEINFNLMVQVLS